MGNVVKVGMADLNICTVPDTIRTSGLGSCVGVALYCPVSKISGLAHVMLPNSDLNRELKFNKAKYADTAIPLLLSIMQEKGADIRRLKAKLAGGAQMFSFQTSDALRIGPRNVEACKEQLKKFNIPIIGEDTGGNSGRTIELDSNTGILHIRTVNKGNSAL